jgi:hypothetical protein
MPDSISISGALVRCVFPAGGLEITRRDGEDNMKDDTNSTVVNSYTGAGKSEQ